jgi:uncharacterized protein YhaN
MRISRLDLFAFGHFIDAKLDLPARVPDLHLVFGLNEAGKSTTLAAIEDLLFGISHTTRYGFIHEYNTMRLGAVLNDSGKDLEFSRRKGKGDTLTLLGTGGLPVPGGEGILAPYLNGVDRDFYARMFCLDHERLRRGGEDILSAHDDVGRILFSIGAGVTGLKDRVTKLREDAGALWANRRASHRKYYQAEDRLQEAENTLREQLVTAKKWQDLQAALQQANEGFSALEAQIETKTAEARKLSRIRRVYRPVQRQTEIAARLDQLASFPELPEGAAKVLSDTLDSESEAKIRIATAADQIAALRNERSSLAYDEALLARGDDIERLHELRIRTRNQKDDLPKRRAELVVAEDKLKRSAEELSWDADDPAQTIARLRARAKLADARSLLQKRGGLAAAVEGAGNARQEADARVVELAQEIEEEGTSRDVTSLAATIQAIKTAGDFEANIAAAELDAQTAVGLVTKLLNSLRPSIPGDCDIASLPVPPMDSVKDYRDRRRDLAQRIKSCGDQIQTAELNTARRDKEYKRTASERRAVPAEELAKLRAHRDSGWSIIRRKYIDGGDISLAEMQAFDLTGALPEAYEAALERADLAADERYETAEATAKLAEIARQIAEQQEELEVLRGQLAGHSRDETKLEGEWTALWSGTNIKLLPPDEMLVWLETRTKILEALDGKASADRKIANLKKDEKTARERLLTELAALKVDTARPDDSRPVRVLLELAEAVQRADETKATNRRKLEQTLKKAKVDSATKLKVAQEAEDALRAWAAKWSAAVAALGLDPTSSTQSIEAQIAIIDEMRETAKHIDDLRHERIEKIERDIAAFEADVAELVPAVAPQLDGVAAEDAVLNLESLLKQAEQAREAAKSVDDKIAAEQKKLADLEQQSAASRRSIEGLQAKAGVDSVDGLKIAIDRSNELRSLRSEREQIAKALLQDGDGLSLAELANECQSANLDQIASHEQTITQELTEIRNRQIDAGQARSAAQTAFDAIGGDDRMARAAADKQSALAEMRDVAEQYIRLRSAELLLQHAIERYRREKQAPLLKRAGELFAILTGGSFKDLQVEFEEGDKMIIVGIRRNGRKVGVSGMTGGSIDQLYIALRVAAVEDYLSRSAPLPFIADDLFINFDDRRAGAGFKVLAELAKKTQVLFFTHHHHLIEVADTALNTNVSVIDIGSVPHANDAVAAEELSLGQAATG